MNNPTSLTDRYLEAIRRYLNLAHTPQPQEILTELSSNLQSEMEDRAEELGRPLTLDEEAAVLKRHGHPMQVAVRYMPSQHLIGPLLFPIYLLTLRRALPMVIAIYAIVRTAIVLTSGYLHSGVILEALLQLPQVLFIFWAVVTLIFALFERGTACGGRPLSHLASWDPRKLPEPYPPITPRILPKHPLVDIIGEIVLLAVIFVSPNFPRLFLFGPLTHLLFTQVSPVWHNFYYLFTSVLVIRLGLKLATMSLRHVERAPETLWIAAEFCSVVMAMVLLRGAPALFPMNDVLSPNDQHAIQFALTMTFRIVLLAAGCSFLWKLYQLFRPKAKSFSLNLA